MKTDAYPFAIQRGDPLVLVYRSKDGTTPFAGDDWSCQLRHSRHGPAWTLTPDLSEQAGTPPLIRFTLDGDETVEIEHNLLEGEIAGGGETQHRFTIQVEGEFNTLDSA